MEPLPLVINSKLRPYQKECMTKILESIPTSLDNERSINRLAVSLPTGSGKTFLFTHLIPLIPQPTSIATKTLILVHRKELANQAFNTVKSELDSSIRVGIDMAESKINPKNFDIIIGSVQSLRKGSQRLLSYDPSQFKCVIIDEAHHAAAQSYLNILDHFGILSCDDKGNIKEKKSDIILLGFSATLQRHDKKNLDEIFKEVVYHLPVEQLINEGHLSDAKFSNVKLLHADLSKVKSNSRTVNGNDFVLNQLSEVMNTTDNNEIVLRTYETFSERFSLNSTIFFCVDIEHAETLARLFEAQSFDAASITSNTPIQERTKLLSDFRKGKLSILFNCGILTEGTDLPCTDSIFLCRPTKSKNLLIQMIGRGLRKHEGKDWCHVVDFIGVNGKDVVSIPKLRGLNDSVIDIDALTMNELDALKLSLGVAEIELDEGKKKKEEEKKNGKRIKDMENSNDRGISIKNLEKILKLENDENYQTIKNSGDDLLPDVELTTYETFSDFISSDLLPPRIPKAFKADLYRLLYDSPHRWFMGPKKTDWVLPLYAPENTLRFIKLQMHQNSANSMKNVIEVSNLKDFYDKEDIGNILKIISPHQRIYSIILYESNPNFTRGFDPDSKYEKRFHITALCKFQYSLELSLRIIDNFLKEKNFKPYNKILNWENDDSTESQRELLLTVFQKCYLGFYYKEKVRKLIELLKNEEIGKNPFTKGKSFDLLFLWSVFRTSVVTKHLDKIFDEYCK